MSRIIAAVSCVLAFGLAAAPAWAAKPTRPASLSEVNAPPRGVPVPLAGAGLPALLALGVVGWRLKRSRDRRAPMRDERAGD